MPDADPAGSYLASDGRTYLSTTPPAPGWWLASDLWWYPPQAGEPWRRTRWGLGDVGWGALVVLAASLIAGVIAVAAGVDPDELTDDPYLIAVLLVPNVLGFAGVPWIASRRKGIGRLAADYGLTGKGLDVAIGLGAGIVGLIAAGSVGLGIDALLGAEEATSNVPVDSLGSTGEIVVFAFAIALVTPVIEELFFRGLLYRSLLKRGRSVVRSTLITTAVFTLPHLTAASTGTAVVSLSATIFTLGLAFNLAAHWTGNRLLAPIIAHMVINGTAVIALAVT